MDEIQIDNLRFEIGVEKRACKYVVCLECRICAIIPQFPLCHELM